MHNLISRTIAIMSTIEGTHKNLKIILAEEEAFLSDELVEAIGLKVGAYRLMPNDQQMEGIKAAVLYTGIKVYNNENMSYVTRSTCVTQVLTMLMALRDTAEHVSCLDSMMLNVIGPANKIKPTWPIFAPSDKEVTAQRCMLDAISKASTAIIDLKRSIADDCISDVVDFLFTDTAVSAATAMPEEYVALVKRASSALWAMSFDAHSTFTKELRVKVSMVAISLCRKLRDLTCVGSDETKRQIKCICTDRLIDTLKAAQRLRDHWSITD